MTYVPNSFNDPPPKSPDLERAKQILQGHLPIWDALYDASYTAVLCKARRTDTYHVLDEAEYRDIADEAFARCYAHLDRYRGDSAFAGWVKGYAKNITRRRIDRRWTQMRHHQTATLTCKQRQYACDPLTIVLHRERNAVLWRVMNELDAVDRRIVLLHVLDEQTFTRIAQHSACPRVDIFRRYRNALKTLRERFRELYPKDL